MKRIAEIVSVCGVLLLPGAAMAAILDFTTSGSPVNPVPVGDGISGAFGTLGYTLTATGGSLTRSEGAVGDCGGILACDIDGYGVGDDEIKGDSQTMTLAFDRSVWINEIYFLDLFAKNQDALDDTSLDNEFTETAKIELFDLSDALVATFLYDAIELKQVNGGFGLFDIPGVENSIQAAKLVFSGTKKYGDDGSNDYALAGVFVNDIDVNVVPVPAALPLLLTGLAGFGVMSWRRRRKHAA